MLQAAFVREGISASSYQPRHQNTRNKSDLALRPKATDNTTLVARQEMCHRIALMSFLCRFSSWAYAWRWCRCCHLLVSVIRVRYVASGMYVMNSTKILKTKHLCSTAQKKNHFADSPPTKKSHFADFLHKSTTGSTSTCVFFLYDIASLCHNLSYTFDPKMHHPAWTLRCSNYSVAKRQQFSCVLSTATLSLKFENVVPEGWIWFFPCYIWVIFLLLYEHVRVRVVAFFIFFFRVRAAKKQACGTIW